MKDLVCMVLCAGQGTRMKVKESKMLQELVGKPLCAWSLDLSIGLKAKQVLAVLGYQRELVQQSLEERYGQRVTPVIQEEQRGTGHAVQVAFGKLDGFQGRVLVLYGDTPLLKASTLQALLTLQMQTHAEVAMLTATVKNPAGYGRIIREKTQVKAIVEERDASDAQKKIHEINPGIYGFDAAFLEANLSKLQTRNAQKEYYLTDLIALATKPIASLEVCEEEILGVNDFSQLARAEKILRRRIAEQRMQDGVRLIDYKTTYIDADVVLEPGVILEPGVCLRGKTRVAAGTRVKAYSVMEDAQVGADCEIGPFAHLRPGTVIGDKCKIGNFVETKKTRMKNSSKANHLAYLGDAQIGEGCNIGAGTITCNYDGKHKHPTQIDDGVFVGSNSTLVAPVRLHEGSYIGAGSVITQDVPAGALGIGRAHQVNKEGWVKKNKSQT